ncbi:MAG: hypothetical protein GY715_14040 [Planctomycetes bacterium]|nr:hypothetical protein [Planctomycetota bacterium]
MDGELANRVRMTVRGILACLAALGVVLALGTVAPMAAAAEEGPFADARRAPADVDLYLHIEDAAATRAALAERPIARAFIRSWRDSALSRAWSAIAMAAASDADTLFDTWLGERFTFVARPLENGGGVDWALWTKVDATKAGDTLARLRPHQRSPRANLPVAELPEHGLRIARAGAFFVIGPASSTALFNDVVDRFGRDEAGESLAALPALQRARSLGTGSTACFIRHAPPFDGWSAMIGRLEGGQLRLRHVGRYDAPPFDRPVTELSIDWSLLDAFEQRSLIAVVEPTDIGGGQHELFMQAALDVPIISASTRMKFGKRRVYAIGEQEGRLADEPVDLLLPAGAVAIELRDTENVEEQLDRDLLEVARAVNDLVPAAHRATLPRRIMAEPGTTRHLDLRPVMNELGDGLPLLRTASLNWAVTRGPQGSFCVIASHPEHLDETISALGAPCGPARTERMTSCGTMSGRRVGMHLRTYGAQAAKLAAPDPETVVAFRETMLLLADLADGVDRCRWQVRRPSREEMSLEIQITLSPPESTDGPPPAGPSGKQPR